MGVEVGQFVYTNFAQLVFNLMETTYLRHREGLPDDTVFDARVRGFGVLFAQDGRLWQTWEISRHSFTASSWVRPAYPRAYVEKAAVKRPSPTTCSVAFRY